MGISAAAIGAIASAAAPYAAVAGGIAGVGGTALSYQASKVQQAGAEATAEANSNSANYAAKVAENNATAERQNAEHAVEAGQVKATNASIKNASTVARIGAGMAANGVDINTGSSVDVQDSQRKTGVLDAETVLNNAQLEAYGYRTQATNYENQATLDKAQAGNAITAGNIASEGIGAGADASLLSNASSVAYKWTTSGTKTGQPSAPQYGTTGNDPNADLTL